MNFKSSGSLGDIIYGLPTIIDMNKRYAQGQPGNLYLQPGVLAGFYEGCQHPSGPFRMSEVLALDLMPLLQAQPYLADVALYEGQHIDLDLDWFRKCGLRDFSGFSLPAYYLLTFKAHCDLSQPWLWIEPDKAYAGRLVVARTTRYRNLTLNYAILDKYEPVFVGLCHEFDDFRRNCPSAEHALVKDFGDIARIVQASKVFVANQTAAYAVAEGLKHPARILEVCPFCPNVVPQGPGGWPIINQQGLEFALEELMS